MSTVIVDARGWQNTFDLKTGEKIGVTGPGVELARRTLQRHPYPGDMDLGSNRWVSDTALDLIDGYDPRFVFLTYAAQYFRGRYTPMTKGVRAKMISEVFVEMEHFLKTSGLEAVVVGMGDMMPLMGFVDVTGLDGFAICTHWSARYAGLYNPSPEDMKALRDHPHIDNVVSREEIVHLFRGTPEEMIRVPEYLILAREGYAFKTTAGAMKTPARIPAFNFEIPLHAPGCSVEDVTGIYGVLERNLLEKKTAFIVLEGVGLADFPGPCSPCRNGNEWYYYEPGEAQYLTVTTGRHRFLDYPTGSGFKYFNENEETQDYPFSGLFKSIPEGTFGSAFAGKSIAVGNKSMFMHMVSGADLSVECFSRNMHNQGTMAVVHREDKI